MRNFGSDDPKDARAGIPTVSGPTVVYLTGWGRSGSTLLDELISQATGGFSAGELDVFWGWRFEGRSCACGTPHSWCPVWSRVLDEVEATYNREEVRAARAESLRMRHVARAVVGPADRPAHGRWEFVREAQALLYQSISRVTGRSVVVDSSKSPFLPYFVGRSCADCPQFRVVQLVRHPCAVAFSWSRPKTTRDGNLMPSYGALQCAAEWMVRNLIAELATRLNGGTLVRYEDLVEDGGGTLADLLLHLRLPATGQGSSNIDEVHAIAGNPSRSSERAMRVDDRWLEQMPARSRVAVSVLTSPLRRRYRYPARWLT